MSELLRDPVLPRLRWTYRALTAIALGSGLAAAFVRLLIVRRDRRRTAA